MDVAHQTQHALRHSHDAMASHKTERQVLCTNLKRHNMMAQSLAQRPVRPSLQTENPPFETDDWRN